MSDTRIFRVGDRVVHASLGPGVVREMRTRDAAFVRFRHHDGRSYSALVSIRALRLVARAVRDRGRRDARRKKAARDEKRKRPHERHENRVLTKRVIRRMALHAVRNPDVARGPLHDALLELFGEQYDSVVRDAHKQAKAWAQPVEVVLRINALGGKFYLPGYRPKLVGDPYPFYTRAAMERALESEDAAHNRVATYVTPTHTSRDRPRSSRDYAVQRHDGGRWVTDRTVKRAAQADARRAEIRAAGGQSRVRDTTTGAPRDPDGSQRRAANRKVSRTRRRDPDASARCDAAYSNAHQLHNAVDEEFGYLNTPKSDVSRSQLYAAWHRVADAWEVAHDACLEHEPNSFRARHAGLVHRGIITAMRSAFEPRQETHNALQIARGELRRARKLLAQDGFDDLSQAALANALAWFQTAERGGDPEKRAEREEATKQVKIVRRLLRTLRSRSGGKVPRHPEDES